jgi:hypothetical protein
MQADGGRDTPAVRILPMKVVSQEASSSGIPPQGNSNSSKPMEEGDLKLVVSKVGRLYQGKNKLFELPGRSTKARVRQGSTGAYSNYGVQ